MYIAAGAGDAAARLHRRDHDARRSRRSRSSRPAICRPSTTTRSSPRTARIMIFFVAMPFVIGLMNFVVPLQLGVRDVAFPTLNSVGFWLTATGALLVNISLVVGEFARTGWLPYPPLSELTYSPGVGVDYYLWALQISGVGTLLTGINLVTTILKMRAPGMTYLRMPMFCWTALAVQPADRRRVPDPDRDLAMLLLDRYLGFHFFTNEAGGNVMMFMNLIWAWGHPGGLHPGPAGVRRVLRSDLDLLGQAAVRLPLDGAGDDGRSASSRSWSGCTTSSPWARAPTSTRSSASPR